MTCTHCGAPINPKTNRCEYCGTSYESDIVTKLQIETYTRPCEVLQSCIVVPDELIIAGGDDAKKYIIDKLSRNLADALVPYMRVETEFMPEFNRYQVRSNVRVLYPDYKF